MKKAIISAIMGVLLAYPAAADLGTGGCPYAGSGMMGGFGWFGGGLLWLVYVALAAFVFALVFWGTKKLMFDGNKKHHKKR
jgi:uncharacterized membrane protein